MKHIVLVQYQYLANLGYLEPLRCPQKDHLPLLVDHTELELYMKCLQCNYRIKIGLRDYQIFESRVKYIENNLQMLQEDRL